MSTRCQIQFIEGKHKTQIYQHSDGYPEGIISQLKRVYAIVTSTRNYRGPDYLAAQFIFLSKFERFQNNAMLGYADKHYELLGHGIEKPNGKIHGDEEYLYKVTILSDETWNVAISEKFTSFKDAVWKEYTLPKAYNKFSKR